MKTNTLIRTANCGYSEHKAIELKLSESGLSVDGNNGATRGQNVHAWTSGAGANRVFFRSKHGSKYMFRKGNSPYCLDGGDAAQNVHLWTCDSGNSNQLWSWHQLYDHFGGLKAGNGRWLAVEDLARRGNVVVTNDRSPPASAIHMQSHSSGDWL